MTAKDVKAKRPYNKRAQPLSITSPALTAQWHATRNGELTPEDVTAGSNRVVWWQCISDPAHVWSTKVSHRSRGSGCPKCAHRGRYSPPLSETDPDLAAQAVDPSTGGLPAGSHKKVWWRCERGHEWLATVQDRHAGNGCAVCANKAVVVGVNDLASQRPDLAADWHPERNGDITPSQIAVGSNKRVWWRCSKDPEHEWSTRLVGRTGNRAAGCPYCVGRLAQAGKTDLATLAPNVAAEWDDVRNGDLTPSGVTVSAGRVAFWLCPLGHSYRAKVASRTRGVGCPYCTGTRVLPNFNDLLSRSPDIAAQWHPTKNAPLLPSEVTWRSGKRVWWKCDVDESHVWITDVGTRTRARTGCPSCAEYGYDPSKPGWLYLIGQPDLGLLQVGISNNLKVRLGAHRSRGWIPLDQRGPMDGALAREMEQDILQRIRCSGAIAASVEEFGRFSGYTEAWLARSFPTAILGDLFGTNSTKH